MHYPGSSADRWITRFVLSSRLEWCSNKSNWSSPLASMVYTMAKVKKKAVLGFDTGSIGDIWRARGLFRVALLPPPAISFKFAQSSIKMILLPHKSFALSTTSQDNLAARNSEETCEQASCRDRIPILLRATSKVQKRDFLANHDSSDSVSCTVNHSNIFSGSEYRAPL